MVFVEKSAEQVASMHPAWLAVADDFQSSGWVRRFQSERPVRTVPVVVLDVDPQELLQPRGVPEVGQLSCRVVVFVDQAAEDVTAAELSCDQRLRLAIAL